MAQRSNDGPAKSVAIPALDGQLVTGPCVLLGFVAKDDQNNQAHFHLHDGTSTAGKLVAAGDPPNGGHHEVWYGPGGIAVAGGIYIDIVSGTPTGSVFYR
jgi:hypothetical protein